MELNRPQDHLLIGFITLSLLLHLLLLYLVPELKLTPAPAKKEPVYVEMRPPQLRERELDLPVPERETPRETPAKRLGPADQVVKKETAPKGEAPEDRAPATVRPPPPAAKPQPRVKTPPKAPETVMRPAAERAAPAPAAKREAPRPLPDLPTLMAATDRAAQTVAEQAISEWRRKYRADVEEGDAAWLDTERDILISFFQRFRNNIYGVWNYPARSAERREEGTCLLKVTINRDGTVQEVRLMESSGYRALDNEAIAAVKKGAPYGDLPRAYKEDVLNVFAFFQYKLSLRQFRGGDIY